VSRKLLIIHTLQFGYHIDSYEYVKNLKNDFEITYLCFDNNLEKIIIDGVRVQYVTYKRNFVKRGLRFVVESIKLINKNNYFATFVIYFQFVTLLRLLLPFHNFILDIRTGAVDLTHRKNKVNNKLMWFESLFFKNITVISENLRDKLKLQKRKTHILPLGADQISSEIKKFDQLKLLYVGTLLSRNIHQTVIGLSEYLDQKGKDIVSYDIVGSGSQKEEQELKNTIANHKLTDIVTFHGFIKHEELKPFFDKCNIGISYVPINEFFNCQPPTKTYEYINSGLLCVATNTYENKLLITKNNGILCDDNPRSFMRALAEVNKRKEFLDSNIIAETLYLHNWKNITKLNLLPYLLKFRSK